MKWKYISELHQFLLHDFILDLAFIHLFSFSTNVLEAFHSTTFIALVSYS
jgi:hypothetical protein